MAPWSVGRNVVIVVVVGRSSSGMLLLVVVSWLEAIIVVIAGKWILMMTMIPLRVVAEVIHACCSPYRASIPSIAASHAGWVGGWVGG